MSATAGLDSVLGARLDAISARDRYRRRRVVAGAHGPRAWVDGRDCLVFCSNDYLGLATHPALIRALADAAGDLGVGSGASQLVSGHNRVHAALEEELAGFVGRPRALLFGGGFMANLGIIAGLLGRGDQVFGDRLNHASLLDGARLSGARLRRYAHADPAALDGLLSAAGEGHRLVVSDAVFSMDGDCAPVPALADVATRHGAWLMVDDAHGFGVLGEHGEGLVAGQGLGPDRVPVLVATLGKSLGSAGAFVAGSEALIEALIQSARTLIYSTAPPPAVSQATRVALRLVRKESWRRKRLHALIRRLRAGAAQLGLPLSASETPIQPLVVGSDAAAMSLSQALFERGFLVTAIRPPTVPAGTARLRITLSAAHEEAHVDRLLDTLSRLVPAAEPISGP